MHWSHLKLPLKGPSQPHLSCFCLHTWVWLLYFIQSISKQTKSLWNYWILSWTYFQEHNLINKILLHHTISIILMASKIAEADSGSLKSRGRSNYCIMPQSYGFLIHEKPNIIIVLPCLAPMLAGIISACRQHLNRNDNLMICILSHRWCSIVKELIKKMTLSYHQEIC